MRVSALIAAAGKGSRFGAEKNKLLTCIGGKTILGSTVQRFDSCALIDDITVVAAKEDAAAVAEICRGYGKVINIAQGGSTRTQSVLSGLKAIAPPQGIVLIHDGARPFVSESVISRCIEGVRRQGSAIAALPVTDTVMRAEANGKITAAVDRQNLYCLQTPQAFMYNDILGAYEKIPEGESFSDDSSVYMKYFGSPHICSGEPANIKITFNDDINLKGAGGVCRSGIGYDSHRLIKGRKLVLGGAEIACDMGLYGHSDADAVIHAVIDSMLSAAGEADIGTHFPDDSKQYKDISSMTLLSRVRDILSAKGFVVANLSCAVLCQSVKLKPYIPQMKENIADCLGIAAADVGISAKTNEGMGFVGRDEGIAVIANCMVKRV